MLAPMKLLPRSLRLLGLAFAVLLPLEQVHCTWAAVGAGGDAAEEGEHGDASGNHACHHSPAPTGTPHSDPCCASCFQLLTVMVPTSVSLIPPSRDWVLLATIPPTITLERTPKVPDLGDPAQAHSKSPPDPAVSSQSPRGPPLSV